MKFDPCQAIAIIPPKAESYFQVKPVGRLIPWAEAFEKLSKKISWESMNDKYDLKENPVQLKVLSVEEVESLDFVPPVIVFVGINSVSDSLIDSLAKICNQAEVVTAFDCVEPIQNLQKYGKYDYKMNGFRGKVLDFIDGIFKFRKRRAHKMAYSITQDMWTRKSIDDLLFMMFVLIDTFGDYPIKSVASVTNTESTSWSQVRLLDSSGIKQSLSCTLYTNLDILLRYLV
jgi:hypothetical protein